MKNRQRIFEQTIISTRIRLARNLAGYPFPACQTERHALEVAALVRNALANLDDDWMEYDMNNIGESKAELLREQYLISPALVGKLNATAFVSADERVSVMVNEEDHLREQYIVSGFNFESAYERISSLDEGIGNYVNFAYDKRLGFLTACPSNVGTGLRASVMMFLPALESRGMISDFVKQWDSCGLTVRGVFGEGTASDGYRYQFSNDKTLGVSEYQLLIDLKEKISEIAFAEEEERKRMVHEDGLRLEDECVRAYGVLTNCAKMGFAEANRLLTKVKLGVALDFFSVRGGAGTSLDKFIDKMRPYSFCEEHGLYGMDTMQRECRRAVVLHVGTTENC